MTRLLCGLLTLACLLSTAAHAQGVIPTPYAELKQRLDARIAFDSLTTRPEPGLSLDHPAPVDGAHVGAGFAGQGTVIYHSGDARHDDIATPRADAPLRLRGDGPGQGLAFAWHRGFGSAAVFPLGPDGFDKISGRGEGALAVLFAQDQWAVGLRIHSDYPDPLGARDARTGRVRILLMGRDGGLLATYETTLRPGITDIGLAVADGRDTIAGMLVLNDDPGGIAVDDILFQRGRVVGRVTPLTAPEAPRRMQADTIGKDRKG